MGNGTTARLSGSPISQRQPPPNRALSVSELLDSNLQGTPGQGRDQGEADRTARASTANPDERLRRNPALQTQLTPKGDVFVVSFSMPRTRLWIESLPTTPTGRAADPPDELTALHSDLPCWSPSPETHSTASMASEGQHSTTMATELSPPNPTGAEIEAAKRALRRARNREAAYKSRAKKSKEISALEEDVQRARTRRTELSMYAEELRSEVFMLKNEILMHCDCDHAPIRQYLRNSISKLQSGLLQGEGSANPPCAGDIDNR